MPLTIAAHTTANAVQFMTVEMLSAKRSAFSEGSVSSFRSNDRISMRAQIVPAKPVASGALIASATTKSESARGRGRRSQVAHAIAGMTVNIPPIERTTSHPRADPSTSFGYRGR
jgi:hypothetical protein